MKPIERYEKDGYVILKGFFSEDEIALLDRYVDRIYRIWRSENEAAIFNRKLVNMHSLTHPEYFQGSPDQRAEFFNTIASQKLTETLENIFGSGLYFHNTQLFFNPSNSERLPYWHRDSQYSSIEDSVQSDEQHRMLSLHIRIPLIDEKGVEVVVGTHKRWDTELERNVRFELNGHNNSESLPDSVLLDLKQGDVLVFNAQMIHRGNYELNSERKAFDLCVGKFHPLVSGFLDPQVLPTDEEIDNIVNNQWYRLAREIAAKLK
ncbi:phytanoyl-CoA dioxygenase family protein [Marinomonas mediterranea]|uniref:Phytanoyl-CoA dioxygenase n=1 Tax=Marinomonas mediterranea (strain ATCC 700492 / JCM 21426 / NBRC 103028 / MMB-1) TaxID=717774 RepID=F2JUA6_MARM1|nr:phytanoyl-CoA dioxygenase family protein [Marinomonas mediterranea]ADZ92725.1 Phytanoyl-CoA dioxygenase [Marinomonas mediterranea MMB-1]WCN10656.1 phytanoyl-CoA dioxygenase [Marinomonas mediterranea]WCN14713.1 phytanoyl-CoA dioxygenase [Marinomonas mediterranea]WCN18754.1 phytanoyl-CoA dioxygenase [Marinomonas mediterranea MMB-1]